MFLPIGDIPNPKTTPYVNWLLIGVNVAVFLFIAMPLTMQPPDFNDPALYDYLRVLGAYGKVPQQVILDNISAYDLLVYKYGFRPADPTFISLFSAMFLHAGWLHLGGNMLFLYIYGDNVEHRLGHVGYLFAYLVAGLAATIFFGMFVPDSQVPMLGASGAISGVLGFYFLWFPRNQVKVLVFLFPILVTTLLIPARIVLGFYLVIDNILPFLTTPAEGGGVAHGAHIGGFLTGLAVAAAVDRLPGLLNLSGTPKVSRKRSDLVSAVTDIVTSLGRSDVAHAADRFLELETRGERGHLATPNILTIGDYLLGKGRYDDALTVFRRLIAERPGDVNLDHAYLGAGMAMMQKPHCEAAAWHYFLAAIDLAQTPALRDRARGYLDIIERHGNKPEER